MLLYVWKNVCTVRYISFTQILQAVIDFFVVFFVNIDYLYCTQTVGNVCLYESKTKGGITEVFRSGFSKTLILV